MEYMVAKYLNITFAAKIIPYSTIQICKINLTFVSLHTCLNQPAQTIFAPLDCSRNGMGLLINL